LKLCVEPTGCQTRRRLLDRSTYVLVGPAPSPVSRAAALFSDDAPTATDVEYVRIVALLPSITPQRGVVA